MSIAIMTEVWKDAPVSGTELLMLLALADSANDDRECWPSLRHLQHKVRVSRNQTYKLLKSLERQGLIEIGFKKGRGKPGMETNMYRILPSISQDTTPSISQDTTPSISQDTVNRHSESSGDSIAAGAGDAQGDPKPSPKKPSAAKAERPRNVLFDAVAKGSFQLADVNGDKQAGARIGKIVSWLKTQSDVTAERVEQFYSWYSAQNQRASAPRDVSKFAEWWLKFAGQNTDDDDDAAWAQRVTDSLI